MPKWKSPIPKEKQLSYWPMALKLLLRSNFKKNQLENVYSTFNLDTFSLQRNIGPNAGYYEFRKVFGP